MGKALRELDTSIAADNKFYSSWDEIVDRFIVHVCMYMYISLHVQQHVVGERG